MAGVIEDNARLKFESGSKRTSFTVTINVFDVWSSPTEKGVMVGNVRIGNDIVPVRRRVGEKEWQIDFYAMSGRSVY